MLVLAMIKRQLIQVLVTRRHMNQQYLRLTSRRASRRQMKQDQVFIDEFRSIAF